MKSSKSLRLMHKAIPFLLFCCAGAAASTGAPLSSTDVDALVAAHAPIPDSLLLDLRAKAGSSSIKASDAVRPFGTPDWLLQEVSASDGAPSDQFGWAVAIQGNLALIAAPNGLNDGSTSNYGEVYVYHRNTTTGAWEQGQKIFANGGSFGVSLALDGDTAMVSAYVENTFSGAVYVFNQSGGTWTQVQRLVPDNTHTHDEFGFSLAMHGDTALIASATPTIDGDPQVNQGAVFEFKRGADGQWTQTQTITSNNGQHYDLFGRPVEFLGDTAVMGAGYVPILGAATRGSAYIFKRDADGTWVQDKQLIPTDGDTYDNFGGAVALDAESVYIGASGALGPSTPPLPPPAVGAVYVYDIATGALKQKLTSDGTTTLGGSLTLKGSTLMVGASHNQAHVFSKDNGSWTETAVIEPDDGDADGVDSFGWSIALSGADVLIGAYNHEGQAMYSGAAYFYQRPSHTVTSSVAPPANSGTISPSGPQQVADGDTIDLTLTPRNADYFVTNTGGTCPGNLHGNIYTVGPVTSDCTVEITFTFHNLPYQVMASAGPGGTIDPDGEQDVYPGNQQAWVTITPDSDHSIGDIGGTCPYGAFISDTTLYHTGDIHSDCTVEVNFNPLHVTVTSSVNGGHGSISPGSQSADYGSTASLTLTPDPGYAVASATGCDGALNGNDYLTGSLTEDCEVVATFAPSSKDTIFANGFEAPQTTCEPAQLFQDPSLEQQTHYWDSYDSQFGTSFCDASCDSTGTITAHSGIVFSWMGGTPYAVTSTLGQSVVIPNGQDRWLNFWMIDQLDTTSTLTLTIDGNQVADFPAGPISITYVQKSFQIPAVYADGQSHNISFTYERPSDGDYPSGAMLDDITLDCSAAAVAHPAPIRAGITALLRRVMR